MKKFLLIITVVTLLISVNLSAISCAAQTSSASVNSPTQETDSESAIGTEQTLQTDMSQVVASIRQSVVAIDIEATTYDFFNQPQTVEGAGSGWIVDSKGYVVTNNHVVEGADNVTVTLSDGRTYPADKVMTDALTDIAVIKIDADNLKAAPVGDADELDIAEWVAAIGNSLGMGISATVGVVSALDVSLQESPGQTLHGLIQTDAAINPGNSGGPLVNTSGEVIGINSIKIAQVGVEGMGYAISINEAMPIIQKLIDVGYVVRPWLGINAYTVDIMVAARYNLAVDKGVLLADIVPGGPAEQAGLEIGDIIVSVDENEIDNTGELVEVINGYSIGKTVQITYWRGQSKNSTSLTLAESPAK